MDYYAILEIAKGASQPEVRSAYLRLTAANHPDLNPGTDTSQRIREIQEAYEVLSDLKARAKYDLDPEGVRDSDIIYDSPYREPEGFAEGPFQTHPASAARSATEAPWFGPTQYDRPRSSVIGLIGVVLGVVSIILGCVVYQRFQADMAIEYSSRSSPGADYESSRPRFNNAYPSRIVKTKAQSLAELKEMKKASKDSFRKSAIRTKRATVNRQTNSEAKPPLDDTVGQLGPLDSVAKDELEDMLNETLDPQFNAVIEINPDATLNFDEFDWQATTTVPTTSGSSYVSFAPSATMSKPSTGYVNPYSGSASNQPVGSTYSSIANPSSPGTQHNTQHNNGTSGLPSAIWDSNRSSTLPDSQGMAGSNPIGQRSLVREKTRTMTGSLNEMRTQPGFGALGPGGPARPKGPAVPYPHMPSGTNGASPGANLGPPYGSGLAKPPVLSTARDHLSGIQMAPGAPVPGGGQFGVGASSRFSPGQRTGPPAVGLPPLGGASNSRLQSLPSFKGPGLNGSY